MELAAALTAAVVLLVVTLQPHLLVKAMAPVMVMAAAKPLVAVRCLVAAPPMAVAAMAAAVVVEQIGVAAALLAQCQAWGVEALVLLHLVAVETPAVEAEMAVAALAAAAVVVVVVPQVLLVAARAAAAVALHECVVAAGAVAQLSKARASPGVMPYHVCPSDAHALGPASLP